MHERTRGTATKTEVKFVIRNIGDLAGYNEVEELQMRVWGDSPRTVVPNHLLYLAATSGGILAGAYVDQSIVGFVFGLLGQRESKLYHASHMLGILPEFQGAGIGAALKIAQRRRAIEQGLDLMTWTFDPLEAKNAHFNLRKLGVTSKTYLENAYGSMDDSLNRGLPSDRLYVEWTLDESIPQRHVLTHLDPLVILRESSGAPLLELPQTWEGGPLAVAIPKSIQDIKRRDPEAALSWRVAVRDALKWAFLRGFVIRDFAAGAYILKPERHIDRRED